MALERQLVFWVAALAVFVAVLWLLSDVLLPFVAGMALAYLLDPIARRAEGLGISRAVSALVVLTLVIVLLVVVVMAAAPIVSKQFVDFIENLPAYLTKLQSIVSDPSRPWLAKLFGGEISDPSKSVGSLVTQGLGYVAGFLTSIWSGGRAVFSVLSSMAVSITAIPAATATTSTSTVARSTTTTLAARRTCQAGRKTPSASSST